MGRETKEEKDDQAMNRELKARGIFLCFVAAILVCTLVAYLAFTMSWFSENRTTRALDGELDATGEVVLGGMSVYRYDEETDTLLAVDAIRFNPYPSVSDTYVLIMENDSDDSVDFTYSLEDFFVNYYGLQQFTQSAALDRFLEQYISAGPYIRTIGSVPLDFRQISTEDYLSFVHPVTNAIKVQTGSFAITDALRGVGTANEKTVLEYAADEITADNLTLGTPQTLFSSTQGVTSLSANADDSTLWVLDPALGADDYTPLTGTAVTFAAETLPTLTQKALVMRLTFDETVYSQATLGTAPDTYQAQLLNSNPFMFQRIKAQRIVCHTTRTAP